MSDNNTQLTSAYGYNTNRMIFSVPQIGSISNGKGPEIKYKRILISSRNTDGTVGDLIIPTEELFSFGVGENTNLEGNTNGYVMPLCLYNRDGPSKKEQEWVTNFNNIVNECKNYLIANRDEIEKYELDEHDFKRFNSLYWKREKGKIVEGTGPTLYPKLLISKKKNKNSEDGEPQNKIISMFFDYDGQSIDPMTLLGKYCFVKAAVKIESIFIGNKISLQVKLYECEVKLMDTGMKRLLKRPTAQTRVLTTNSSRPLEEKVDENENVNEDVGSVKDSDSENENVNESENKKSDKKVVKRRVKKVVRKPLASDS